MVLSGSDHRGAGTARPTGSAGDSRRGSRRSAPWTGDAGERGSQALEFALTLPGVALCLVLVVHVGGVAADVVRAQHVARDAARAAVLDQPYRRPADADVRIIRDSGAVTVTVRLRSRWASRFDEVDVTGRAVMVAEP